MKYVLLPRSPHVKLLSQLVQVPREQTDIDDISSDLKIGNCVKNLFSYYLYTDNSV